MNIIYGIILLIVATICVLAAFTRIGTWWIEYQNPPTGQFITVLDTDIHYQFLKAADDKPTLVFVHGANGNIHDQMSIYGNTLKSDYNLLFFDRPGLGYSSIGKNDAVTPDKQADILAALMDALEIEQALIVGHSFGGAVTVSFALRHPAKTLGQLLLAPVSHPWPGGIESYYSLASRPMLGRLFVNTLTFPAALARLKSGTACVFAPNKPTTNYIETTKASLLMRPGAFRQNARQVEALFDYVSATYENYTDIKTPTVILTGNRDTVVLPEIHSVGLSRAIEGAQLYWIENLGHKPDHIAKEFVVEAIKQMTSEKPIDLTVQAAALEKAIAHEASGPLDKCLDGEVILNALSKEDKARLGLAEPTYD